MALWSTRRSCVLPATSAHRRMQRARARPKPFAPRFQQRNLFEKAIYYLRSSSVKRLDSSTSCRSKPRRAVGFCESTAVCAHTRSPAIDVVQVRVVALRRRSLSPGHLTVPVKRRCTPGVAASFTVFPSAEPPPLDGSTGTAGASLGKILPYHH